jgi:hypothetical protein
MVGAFGAKASGCNGLTQRRSRTAVEAARQSQTEGGGVTRRRFSAVEVVGGGTAAPRTGCNDSDGGEHVGVEEGGDDCFRPPTREQLS